MGMRSNLSLDSNSIIEDSMALRRLSKVAEGLADSLVKPGPFQGERVMTELAAIARELTDADVAYCRTSAFDETLHLSSDVIWGFGAESEGTVPQVKHRDDCLSSLDRIEVRPVTADLQRRAERRVTTNGQPFYTPSDLKHLDWLASEAFIPLIVSQGAQREVAKAVIALGSGSRNHFDERRLELLQAYWGFFNSAYSLADLVQDRVEKARLLAKIASVLPHIADASSLDAFCRAICTLLTAGEGFGFDRALVFWMNNYALPAECRMAVGGSDVDWPARRTVVDEAFRHGTLSDYIRDSLEHPVPGTGVCNLSDPLFAAVREGTGLFFRETDEGAIKEIIERGGLPCERITSNDPWINRIRDEQPGIFISPHDEYFVFGLRPLESKAGAQLLGFVIADLAYRPQRHRPGAGFPDLQMTALVLNIVSGLWQFRQRAESYFHVLTALPILQHSAPSLSMAVDGLNMSIQRLRSLVENSNPKLHESFADVDRWGAKLLKISEDFEYAKEVVAGLRDRHGAEIVDDLLEILKECCEHAQKRFEGTAFVRLGSVEHDGAVRIPRNLLESILYCLIDNACTHGATHCDEPIQVTVSARVLVVPEPGIGESKRVLIEVENDGAPISEPLSPYLFIDRISTSSTRGRGTGLSTARLQAKAYGGDVILRSANPVCFAVVLDIF